MNKVLMAVILALGTTETSLASVTYLTCGANNDYSGSPTELSSTYQNPPYNIVYSWSGSTGLNVGYWQNVYYMPGFVFSSFLDAYNFCSALSNECLHHDKNSKGKFAAWTNVGGYQADIYVQVSGGGPGIVDGGALCNTILQYPPATVYYALACADANGYKLSGSASQQELQTYGNLIQNDKGSTSLQGTLQPTAAAPQRFTLANTFNSGKDASAFCNTISAQCKAEFPQGNGSVGVYAPNNNIYPYPLSLTFMVSGSQISANCPYFPP